MVDWAQDAHQGPFPQPAEGPASGHTFSSGQCKEILSQELRELLTFGATAPGTPVGYGGRTRYSPRCESCKPRIESSNHVSTVSSQIVSYSSYVGQSSKSTTGFRVRSPPLDWGNPKLNTSCPKDGRVGIFHAVPPGEFQRRNLQKIC